MFFGPSAASPPKNTFGMRRLERGFIDHRHFPAIELDAQIALDPRKRILLPDGQNHVVSRQEHGVDRSSIAWRRASHSSRSNSMPSSFPFSTTNRLGA